MATKLKNLAIKKVDFVDQGANPDAHIKITKNKDNKGHVSAIRKLFSFIGKSAGMSQEEIDSACTDIEKGVFDEKMKVRSLAKIQEEMWDVCYALYDSFSSILSDENVDSTENAMKESLAEFTSFMNDAIVKWSGSKITNIVKNVEVPETVSDQIAKKLEGEEEMKIDTSKMTSVEKAIYEDIVKRYGVDGKELKGTGEPVNKNIPTPEPIPAPHETKQEEDIYKGMNPVLKAEFESLKKYREEAEEKELKAVAKKYEIIGKKEEDLLPVLKSLKSLGGTAYDDFVSTLDQTVETVEKSGAFTEIGKSGHGSGSVGDAEQKINSIAKSYVEHDPNMSYIDALGKAWSDHPELMAQYDEESGL